MKTVYVVSGSEDGIIGVYGNKKAAYNKCIEYTGGKSYDTYSGIVKPLSYAKCCKELNNKEYYTGHFDLYDYHNVDTGASIEMHTLNH
ncbi:MAG: hypothetical protein Tp1111DCM1112741_40 [Prokaryotic dsDNA virus sp.]|nr:MAG: hypothetical protein Tp1111DCM1112741_40 [Prokaryotic dsDNA virus sp.]|tara:strand:+ start:11798 stop:12061 length:264 start_codon:yes stop_codon:yes gene_type:complete